MRDPFVIDDDEEVDEDASDWVSSGDRYSSFIVATSQVSEDPDQTADVAAGRELRLTHGRIAEARLAVRTAEESRTARQGTMGPAAARGAGVPFRQHIYQAGNGYY